jgi:hypothetical protein
MYRGSLTPLRFMSAAHVGSTRFSRMSSGTGSPVWTGVSYTLICCTVHPRTRFADLGEVGVWIRWVSHGQDHAGLVGSHGFSGFPEPSPDASTLIDDHEDVLPVEALQTGQVLVRRLSTEGDKTLIIGPGVPFGVEGDLVVDDSPLLRPGVRLDHLAPDTALDVVVVVGGDHDQRIADRMHAHPPQNKPRESWSCG